MFKSYAMTSKKGLKPPSRKFLSPKDNLALKQINLITDEIKAAEKHTVEYKELLNKQVIATESLAERIFVISCKYKVGTEWAVLTGIKDHLISIKIVANNIEGEYPLKAIAEDGNVYYFNRHGRCRDYQILEPLYLFNKVTFWKGLRVKYSSFQPDTMWVDGYQRIITITEILPNDFYPIKGLFLNKYAVDLWHEGKRKVTSVHKNERICYHWNGYVIKNFPNNKRNLKYLI
jgi:hypothetical protein